jgi:hypothetical protein
MRGLDCSFGRWIAAFLGLTDAGTFGSDAGGILLGVMTIGPSRFIFFCYCFFLAFNTCAADAQGHGYAQLLRGRAVLTPRNH